VVISSPVGGPELEEVHAHAAARAAVFRQGRKDGGGAFDRGSGHGSHRAQRWRTVGEGVLRDTIQKPKPAVARPSLTSAGILVVILMISGLYEGDSKPIRTVPMLGTHNSAAGKPPGSLRSSMTLLNSNPHLAFHAMPCPEAGSA
jgi:hypothetical protein